MGETALKQALQKAFCVLKQVMDEFSTTNNDCQPVIMSLVNILEQYECCQCISIDDIPFNTVCPDLKEHLQYKIVAEIEVRIQSLQTNLDKFKDYHSKVSQQYHNLIKVYKTYWSTDLNIDIMTKTPALYPSLSEMVEWLNTAEKLLFQIYQSKKFIIDELVTNTNITSENLVSQWTVDDHIITSKFKDYLCYLTYFMEEKI
ncbi:hypothetical protein SNE40_007587 [Patella caerulea]|uniref:Uncharacterized protein n=1 Tax=Patella caerulea TaxID=87958 RepID=A0AAN8K690_PATCE